MKTLFNSSSRLCHLAAFAFMFVAPLQSRADVNQLGGTNFNGIATVSSVGPNSRTWLLPLNTNLLPFISSNSLIWNMTNSQFAELATGMNYWDGQQWSPSVASFQAVSNGFAASQTQHKVFLNGNLNVMGAVTVTTPEGTNLYSSPIAIALYDAASGNMSIIGTITNCSGTQTASNTVVYPNAFNGVCASLIYTINQGDFHQDVVLTGGINPSDYGYPTNTTRIQIITEFNNPPVPERIVRPIHVEQNQDVRNQMATPDLMDEMLGFGHFTFGAGRAYLAPRTSPQDAGAPVGKQLFNVNGRILLVESVEYKYIWRSMTSLPPCNGGTNSPGGLGAFLKAGKGKAAYAALPKLPKAGSMAASPKATPKDGVASVAQKGLVIDYTADVSSMDDPTLFQSDTTYFIEGTVYCDGATTIEGGAVFKYPLAVSGFTSASLITENTLTLTTSSYRPAIFTAADDDSVGTKMNTGPYSSYYTGNPGLYYNTNGGYGGPYLSLATSYGYVGNVSHLNFFYAQQALYIWGEAASSPVAISHSQFVHCVQGIELDSGSYSFVSLNNCLFYNVQTVLTDEGSEGDGYSLCNCTLHQTSNTVTLITSDSSPGIASTNGVFVNIIESDSTFTGNHNGFYNSTANGTAYTFSYVNPFDTAISGGHYLDPASGFVGAGTTNIDTNLLADLRNMTTVVPPVILSNITFVENFSLYPQVLRDTNASTVDLGYHYDPIDFLVNNLTVSNGNALSLTSGVVVATYGSVGINLPAGTSFASVGTPLQHNFITQTRAVQESPDAWAAASTYCPLSVNEATSDVYMRFTDITVLPKAGLYDNLVFGGAVPAILLMQDSRVSGGTFWYEVDPEDASMPEMQLHNTVFERSYFDVVDGSEDSLSVSAGVDWFNNLFINCKIDADHFVGTWSMKDNIFDTVTISDSSSSTITRSHDAYVNMSTGFGGTETSPTTLGSFAYAAGPLGPYYQPSGSSLRNIGSRTAAAAGLYHYTVGTNEMKEGSSTVTIGPHYVALNSSGQPDDSHGSGIPDYFADTNGNGVYDAGTDLSNWTTDNTSGSSDGVIDIIKLLQGRSITVSTLPTTGPTGLVVYTPLK